MILYQETNFHFLKIYFNYGVLEFNLEYLFYKYSQRISTGTVRLKIMHL